MQDKFNSIVPLKLNSEFLEILITKVQAVQNKKYKIKLLLQTYR